MFTQAELERANHDMQARLLSVSEQILRELTHLERRMASAPLSVRASALSAAAQIASTQQRLQDQAHHLPASPLRRFQMLRSSLEAQQGALRHLSMIVEAHAPAPVQRLAPASRRVWPELAAPAPPRAFFNPRTAPVANPSPAPLAHLPRAVRIEPKLVAKPPPSPEPVRQDPDAGWADAQEMHQPAPSSRAARGRRAAPRGRLRGAIEGIGTRSLLVVGILAAGAVLSYGMFPRAGEQSDPAMRTIALAPPRPALAAAPREPPTAAPAPQQQPPAPLPAPIRDLAQQNSRTDAPKTAAPPPPSPFITGVTVGVPAPAVVAPAAPTPPPPPAQPAAAAEPVAKQQFVPVVFTHKDDTAAKRAFADLQQKYPKLLGQRRGEAQPVDLGNKGIWHRLVVLPAGARPQATKLCDQLLAWATTDAG